ncbi:MAG: helix-turn-helix domain-containing protein [Thermoplasmataceae archaeon]
MSVSPLGKIVRGSASCSDLISCLYALNSTEIDIFFSLYGMGEITLETLSAAAKRDKSTIHRILEKLVNAGLCFKDTRAMEKGGFRNIYYTLSPEKLVEKLTYDGERIINGLNSAMKQFPENFATRTGLSTGTKST